MRHEQWNALALVAGVLILALVGPWLAREVASLGGSRVAAARADQRIVSLEVGGMTCAGCAATIRGTLGQVPGVAGVEVRFRERRAYVVCDRGVQDSTLTSAVHRAGPGFLAAVASR
jgi:copper chaperone CopZ